MRTPAACLDRFLTWWSLLSKLLKSAMQSSHCCTGRLVEEPVPNHRQCRSLWNTTIWEWVLNVVFGHREKTMEERCVSEANTADNESPLRIIQTCVLSLLACSSCLNMFLCSTNCHVSSLQAFMKTHACPNLLWAKSHAPPPMPPPMFTQACQTLEHSLHFNWNFCVCSTNCIVRWLQACIHDLSKLVLCDRLAPPPNMLAPMFMPSIVSKITAVQLQRTKIANMSPEFVWDPISTAVWKIQSSNDDGGGIQVVWLALEPWLLTMKDRWHTFKLARNGIFHQTKKQSKTSPKNSHRFCKEESCTMSAWMVVLHFWWELSSHIRLLDPLRKRTSTFSSKEAVPWLSRLTWKFAEKTPKQGCNFHFQLKSRWVLPLQVLNVCWSILDRAKNMLQGDEIALNTPRICLKLWKTFPKGKTTNHGFVLPCMSKTSLTWCVFWCFPSFFKKSSALSCCFRCPIFCWLWGVLTCRTTWAFQS